MNDGFQFKKIGLWRKKMKLLRSMAILACIGSFNYGYASEDNSISSYFSSSYLDVKVREKKVSCFDFTGTWVSEIEGRVVEVKQDACDYISITDGDLGATSYFKIGSWVMGYLGDTEDSYLTASRWVDENQIDGRFSLTTDLKNQTYRWILNSVSADKISINMLLTNPNFSSVQYDDYFSRVTAEEGQEEEILPEEDAADVLPETPAEAEDFS